MGAFCSCAMYIRNCSMTGNNTSALARLASQGHRQLTHVKSGNGRLIGRWMHSCTSTSKCVNFGMLVVVVSRKVIQAVQFCECSLHGSKTSPSVSACRHNKVARLGSVGSTSYIRSRLREFIGGPAANHDRTSRMMGPSLQRLLSPLSRARSSRSRQLVMNLASDAASGLNQQSKYNSLLYLSAS